MTPKEKKLKQLQEEMENTMKTVTYEEFTEAFDKVIDTVVQMREKNEADVEEMKAKIDGLVDETTTLNTQEIATIKAEAKKAFETLIKEQSNSMNFIYDKVRSLKNGEDADESKIIKKVLTQIKLPEQKEIILDDAETIRNKLETLEGEDRLDVSAIKGIKELLESLDKKISSSSTQFGAIKQGLTIITASGTVDDSNTAFVFVEKPLMVNVNGTMYREGKGWTWSGSTATLDFAPGVDGDVYGII